IDSTAGGNQKATFGFNLEGVDLDGDGLVDVVGVPDPNFPPDSGVYDVWGLGKGQFNYNDHGTGVNFHYECVVNNLTSFPTHGVWPSGVFVALDDNFNPTGAVFNGAYTSQAGSGTVWITVTTKGDDFSSPNNTIAIVLQGGPYDGYTNSGTIQGGNMQF